MKRGLRIVLASATLALLSLTGEVSLADETKATHTTANPMVGSASLTDSDISNAYIYLLAHLLVTRQQQLDFEEGFQWNKLANRKPGAVDCATS
ncbi:MAG: hypothetical protein CPDRYMAC_2160 [uncultured Paraburkholderia sp.]|nr:MAG: hypothetical protein CPDRYDRY_2090 [uncultured Paraburkholderia sp.]CAH2922892.1 MAG: hypothetical protein CPDRYMAC_2160 [uncultured Paraburkholderia sp.]